MLRARRRGGYSERATVDGAGCFPSHACQLRRGSGIPDGVRHGLDSLTQVVRLAGARVLVTAAAGAVGTAAIQLVRVLNGQPVAAVGSDAKFELPRSLGAVETVTYDGSRTSSPSTPSSTSSAEPPRARFLVKPLGTTVAGYAGGSGTT